jgi:hypothetical protein
MLLTARGGARDHTSRSIRMVPPRTFLGAGVDSRLPSHMLYFCFDEWLEADRTCGRTVRRAFDICSPLAAWSTWCEKHSRHCKGAVEPNTKRCARCNQKPPPKGPPISLRSMPLKTKTKHQEMRREMSAPAGNATMAAKRQPRCSYKPDTRPDRSAS